MKIQEHMELLGMKVSDKVTGFKGVVTSVSFDLYGCIQAIVTPEVSKEGKQEDSRWFDVQRLTVTGKAPVMALPNYEYGYVAEGRKGPAEKPCGKW
jgi:hypothetical protein